MLKYSDPLTSSDSLKILDVGHSCSSQIIDCQSELLTDMFISSHGAEKLAWCTHSLFREAEDRSTIGTPFNPC
jgi:hypothetical protein